MATKKKEPTLEELETSETEAAEALTEEAEAIAQSVADLRKQLGEQRLKAAEIAEKADAIAPRTAKGAAAVSAVKAKLGSFGRGDPERLKSRAEARQRNDAALAAIAERRAKREAKAS